MRKLKRRIALSTIFSVLVLATAFYFHSPKREMCDLQLKNVEALASNESSRGMCIGNGSLDCPYFHVKVYWIALY